MAGEGFVGETRRAALTQIRKQVFNVAYRVASTKTGEVDLSKSSSTL
jgi:hypothetical protein